MGIDIYLKWHGQTKAEEDAQITGFSITAGNSGYLREAYHGGPYVTHHLLVEAFDSERGEADIPAKVLRERLPGAILMATYRNHVVYETKPNVGFVTAPTAKKHPTRNVKEELYDVLSAIFADITTIKDGGGEEFHPNPEQLRAVKRLIKQRMLPDYALAFVDFVALAERKEKETGKPCTIVASY